MRNEIITAEVQRLFKKHDGVLKPSDLVEAARPEDSPLHSMFDWDNTSAAEKWRLHQARALLRVCVRYEESGNEPIQHRITVSLHEDRKMKGGGYRAMVDVLSNDELRAQLLADARNELLRFREKYARLTELAAVFAAIDDLEETSEATTITPTTEASI